MRVVTVARSPLSEANLSKNVLRHGVGGIHVDNTRLWKGPIPKDCLEAPGKWPANVIFIHSPQCRKLGGRIESSIINRWSDGAKPFGDGAGHNYDSSESLIYVEDWECEKDCPARLTDLQRKDSGEFFKQMSSYTELTEYLVIMSKLDDAANILVQEDLSKVVWETYPDSSVTGLITEGNPEAHTKEIMRVLKPGAFVMLLSPESEPTGHTGAWALDVAGFEIRNAILIVDSLEFHYVAKPGPSEKNDGVKKRKREIEEEFAKLRDLEEDLSPFKLKGLVRRKLLDGEEVLRKSIPPEMDDLVAIRTVSSVKEVQNVHPTVKPKKIFEVLFEDVPKDHKIVDPFTGSGSSGLAALTTGHDYLGIDLSKDYIVISSERIRHHANVNAPWKGIQVTADTDVDEEPEEEELDVEDLFG